MAKKNSAAKPETEDTSKAIRARADFPHTFYRVTDPMHPCYAKSVHDTPPRDFIDNIKEHGVIEPIECKDYVIEGISRRCIVVGRGRQSGAEIGFGELLEEGKTLPGGPDSPSSEGRIPYIMSNHLTDQEVRNHSIAENTQRKVETLEQRIDAAINYYKQEQAAAAKGKRKFDEAGTKRRLAALNRIDLKTLGFWFEVLKLPDEARARVLSGEVPVSSVGILLKTGEEQHGEVIDRIASAGALSTREVNEAASDVPQADRPTSGPRDRSQPRAATDKGGNKKYYAPRGPKLEAGIKLAKAKLEEITAKIAPIEDDDEQDWCDGFEDLKKIQAETASVVTDFCAFSRGEPIAWLLPPAKPARKQAPPKVQSPVAAERERKRQEKQAAKQAKADEKQRKAEEKAAAKKAKEEAKANKTSKPAKLTPEQRAAAKEAKKQEEAAAKNEADRLAAVKRQRAGTVDTRNNNGRDAYDEHMLETIRSRVTQWRVVELARIVGGKVPQAKASLDRLHGRKHVVSTGAGNSLRWTAVTNESLAADDAADAEPASSSSRRVEMDDDVQPGLFAE